MERVAESSTNHWCVDCQEDKEPDYEYTNVSLAPLENVTTYTVEGASGTYIESDLSDVYGVIEAWMCDDCDTVHHNEYEDSCIETYECNDCNTIHNDLEEAVTCCWSPCDGDPNSECNCTSLDIDMVYNYDPHSTFLSIQGTSYWICAKCHVNTMTSSISTVRDSHDCQWKHFDEENASKSWLDHIEIVRDREREYSRSKAETQGEASDARPDCVHCRNGSCIIH